MADPTAAELVAHPELIERLEPAAVPCLLAQLTAITAALAARLPTMPPREEADRLLNATEARALLGGISRDRLYNAAALRAARVPVGRRILFSHAALQRLIARRTGRI